MSKSHVGELLLVYEALSRDASLAFPQLSSEFQRDLVRLNRVVRVRGIQLFTVDLPAIGKHLDRCLSEGEWVPPGIPLTGRVSAGPPFPKFLRGLFKLVFDDLGHLKKGDLDVEAVVFLRQFLYCAKSTELPCPPAAVLQEIEDFVAVDNALPIPKTAWAAETVTASMMRSAHLGFSSPESGYIGRLLDIGVKSSCASLLCKNLDLVSGLVASTLGHYKWSEWEFRHGPGAIADRPIPCDKYHWVNWSNRLEERFPIADCGFYSYSSWSTYHGGFRHSANGVDRGYQEIGSSDPFSKLVAVPKTVLKPRLIAAEPSENMWCQQNLRHYFDERCKRSWISQFVNFHDQTRNQELCREGSRSGSLLTCDLSSASDRVTCDVVGQVLRANPELLCHLQAVRTRFLRQDLHPDMPMEIELRKFSTMGSACTFPVESLVFLVITLASTLTSRGLVCNKANVVSLMGQVAVYGDDIVAPCDSWDLLQNALSALHFKVNASKSFATGRFRESCGVDSFRGVDVTPVYWRGICSGNPESIRSALDVRNNFYSKWFMFTARRVESTIPCSFVTVAMDSGVEGKKSFARPEPFGLNLRWNGDLQRIEASSSVLSSRSEKLAPYDDSGLLQYFTEAPSPLTKWEAGVAQRPRLRIRRGWIPVSELGLATKELRW